MDPSRCATTTKAEIISGWVNSEQLCTVPGAALYADYPRLSIMRLSRDPTVKLLLKYSILVGLKVFRNLLQYVFSLVSPTKPSHRQVVYGSQHSSTEFL
ncbi:hypothetical protein T265_03410 [Opisthorchis viverrini]|uniref:Uncharacterized protein n=1 Tax=Opisthorchis viverrini TaxID=6198 RepID=A0A074ZSB3_OPIVI|nr:hypothetical protein T265_03410 [Opisthorchis viverrini]KER30031.1 hypothetical protein T265_03410 [Opisthorchis viverrini]